MRIGLLGFGTVGQGVYELAKSRNDMSVAKVLLRRELELADAVVTHDIMDIVGDVSIDTVVETIGGLHPAFEYVKAALEAGKHVVTANKALVCNFYEELLTLAEQKGVSFRCTAAVGGGIGWLSELERARRLQSFTQVGGIMNGTCNYILDNMTRNGLDYGDVLKRAQELGYAEADPSTDVDGIDTWHKTILSSNIAWGVKVEKSTVPVAGISRISALDVENFTAHGLVCKLIGTGMKENGSYRVHVQPTLVKDSDLEAAVPMNYNLVTFVGEVSGPMSLYGQGAGRYPTAYNVMQDLVDVLSGKSFYAPVGETVAADNSHKMTYYVRGNWQGDVAEHWNGAVVTVPVSVAHMHAWLKENPDAFVAAIR